MKRKLKQPDHEQHLYPRLTMYKDDGTIVVEVHEWRQEYEKQKREEYRKIDKQNERRTEP
jgi:hypothetical protein